MVLNLRDVEVFHAVMMTGGVGRAAGLLETSQPTVSRTIAKLETTCGFRLFDRVRGRLTPTREGQLLFAEVQANLVGLDRPSMCPTSPRPNSTRGGYQPSSGVSCFTATFKRFYCGPRARKRHDLACNHGPRVRRASTDRRNARINRHEEGASICSKFRAARQRGILWSKRRFEDVWSRYCQPHVVGNDWHGRRRSNGRCDP